MTKTIVVLNGVGTTIQSFGVFGGSLEQAKEKFKAICEDVGVKMSFKDGRHANQIIVQITYSEKLWDLLNAVTKETECGGDPPEIYILEAFEVEETDYQKTGAFND